ncbi:hypothetical protein [Rhizobium sp. S96]|uniref:hypothetical protein n=1 Tax=Rhizobium sp. S96 TaxID=3055140 RepID=UPI0025AB0782|nr:hypothetical protein [Rhizobium sp. S96]MDM9619113.1 hypothetical protein [Rhizobium sp. S96]
MSRFPNTRMAVARLLANMSICALPTSERVCIDVASYYSDLLRIRAQTIREKGQHWRFEGEQPSPAAERAEGSE